MKRKAALGLALLLAVGLLLCGCVSIANEYDVPHDDEDLILYTDEEEPREEWPDEDREVAITAASGPKNDVHVKKLADGGCHIDAAVGDTIIIVGKETAEFNWRRSDDEDLEPLRLINVSRSPSTKENGFVTVFFCFNCSMPGASTISFYCESKGDQAKQSDRVAFDVSVASDSSAGNP